MMVVVEVGGDWWWRLVLTVEVGADGGGWLWK